MAQQVLDGLAFLQVVEGTEFLHEHGVMHLI
jgi:hypothetical protein